MSHISQAFERCRQERRAAFIPYLTAGDPDLAASGQLLDALEAGGADLIELGVPFSDPIADGPVNQRAAARALESGTTLSGIFELVSGFRSRSDIPIVLFSYFNPIHACDVEVFAEQSATSGVDGVVCVDLPPEEAGRDFIPALRARGIDTVFLLAPTSTKHRVRQVSAASTGFVYYVSRTGVTGVQERLADELLREAKRLRRRLELPLAVGFGISTPDQVEMVSRVADGVVVGSALVRRVEETGAVPELPALIEAEVTRLSAPLRDQNR